MIDITIIIIITIITGIIIITIAGWLYGYEDYDGYAGYDGYASMRGVYSQWRRPAGNVESLYL